MQGQVLELNDYLAPLKKLEVYLAPLVASIVLLLLLRNHYLVFHTFAEFISIIVAFSIFTFGYYSYNYSKNTFLLILACGYLTIGSLDMLHTLTYKGMSLFGDEYGSKAVEFWIVARFFEATLLLAAPFFIEKKIKISILLISSIFTTMLLIQLVFGNYLPVLFIENVGLTSVKITSEYIIIAILFLAMMNIYRLRHLLTAEEVTFILCSIAFTIMAELAFTFYNNSYGLSNLIGHLFKVFSYWLIFLAIINVNMKQVYSNLQHATQQLADSQKELLKLSLAINQCPVSVVMTDIKGNIEFVNPHFLNVSGYNRDELLGQNPRILGSGEKSTQDYQQMWTQLVSGKPWHGEFKNRCKDGSLYWESSTISPVFDEDGKIINYIGIKDNITEKKQLESEIFAQKAYQEIIFNRLPECIVNTDRHRRIVSINPEFTQTFGYEIDDIRGKPTSVFYESIDDFNEQGKIRYSMTAEELLKPYIVRYQKKNGTLFPGETIGRKLLDNEGKTIGFMGIIRDVTEELQEIELKQQYQLILKQERDRAQLYLDLSPTMFAALDSHGNISLINKKGCQLLGYSEQELLHQNWFDKLNPGTNHDDVRAVFNKILAGKVKLVEKYENILVNASGKERLFSFHNAKIEDSAGNITGVLFNAEDITDKAQSEKTLRHAQKMEAVGELTGGIAHDFNNILGVVMGNLELLQRSCADKDKDIRRIEMALKGVQRGTDITRKLLDFSRGNAENRQEININQLINGMIDLIASSLTPQIEVQTQLLEDLWPTKITPGELEDALLNISLNARDAMPSRGKLMIETENRIIDDNNIRMQPNIIEGEYVLISISDNGCGMSPKTAERVFEPFFSTKSAGRGTGLGLSQVYGFVKREHGGIQIYSEENSGTTIRIYLPRAKQAADILNDVVQQANEIDLPTGQETILVVDDEVMMAEMACDNLNNLGYNTLMAHNANDALKLLQQHPQIDLLFSDIIMPGVIDGYELAIAILKLRPELKILMTSGFSRYREVFVNGERKLINQLAQQLLNKPYNRSELAMAIRKTLDKK